MADLEAFDEASRGLMGSIGLIFKIRWSRAQVGAIIIVLSVLFDPFSQQLVTYPSKAIKLASTDVVAPRAGQYTMIGDQNSITGDYDSSRPDNYLASATLAAIMLGRPRYQWSLSSTSLKCPRDNNCTWYNFPTLAVAHKCANINEHDWTTDCPKVAGVPVNCSYTVEGVGKFDINMPADGGIAPLLELREVSANASRKWLGISDPILVFATMRYTWLDMANSTNYLFYPPEKASVCAFHYAVDKYHAGVTNSQASLKSAKSWRNTSRELTPDGKQQDVYLTPSRHDLRIDESVPFESMTYFVSAKVGDLMTQCFRRVLLGGMNVRQVTDIKTELIPWYTHKALENTPLIFQKIIYTGQTFEYMFESIAVAASRHIQNLPENREYHAEGHTVNLVPVIRVQWGWITIYAVMFCLTGALFVLTVFRGKSNASTWKNSALALLYHGLQTPSELATVTATKEMMQKAKNQKTGVRHCNLAGEIRVDAASRTELRLQSCISFHVFPIIGDVV
ncbi:hypothetical protein F5Y15DRAFT_272716 [Xylariaceae sp. FL0016]|nr:hypothetical protein F5Y15DRAFT_272716 [Xylariaceae sp. FL0016]